MIKAKIEAILRDEFAPESLTVIDESAKHRGHEGAGEGGGHYRIKMVSKLFADKKRIEQHRMIYKSLDALFEAKEIHALAIEA
jgi:BolA protein